MPKDILTDEDRALFREVTASVSPLKNGQKNKEIIRLDKKDVPKKTVKSNHSNNITSRMPSPSAAPTIYLSNYYAVEVQAETSLSYCQHSIPRKRLIELQSGKIHCDRRLDMHGLLPNEASTRLLSFIQEALIHSQRHLLIIHGKGGRQPEKAPVLKNLVNHWLRQIPEVLAFHSAAPKDGGNGALYVLLKRNRC